MASREDINEYDLGMPVPLAPLDERRRAVPAAVLARLAEARTGVVGVLGDRLRELRLFGSHARGQADEDSDVDVLVLADTLLPGERQRVVDVVLEASRGDVILAPLVLSVAQLDEMRRRETILAIDLDREGITL